MRSFTLANGIVMPAVTNKTACIDGFLAGYKDWCSNHAVDCVQNITFGDFPPMILQLHEQYLAGAKGANGSGISMCPIGENAAFCRGWDSNNGVDYGYQDCGDAYDNYTGPFSSNLVGCPLDSIKPSQIAKPHVLVGTWNYVNESKSSSSKTMDMPITSLEISGKIVYGKNGHFNLTIPNNSAFGDYKLDT